MTTTSGPITWQAPGPGTWERDLSHAPAAPTPLFRRIMSVAPTTAYRGVFEEFGGPLETIEMAMVGPGLYRRVTPLIGAQRGDSPPPRAVLWLVSRLHPAFRRREKAAQRSFVTMSYLDTLRDWEDHERADWITRNRALQAEDLPGYDDPALADHIERAAAHLLEGNIRHHVLHGTDMGPIGDLLAHAARWDLDPREVVSLLEGASPATRETARFGGRIAEALRAEGADPLAISSLDDVRAAGPRSGAALDAYLDLYGWRLVTSYDLEGATAGELHASVIALVRAGATTADANGADTTSAADLDARAEAVRVQVPSVHLDLYDRLLDAARRAYGLRDDNGPLTAEWPLGLVRRAYLEAGRRLAGSGRVGAAEHVFEVDTDELAAVLRGTGTPSADDLVARAAHRRWEATLDPPLLLGDPPAELDTSALPDGLRRVTEAVLACVAMLEKPPGGRPLEGMGIGDRVHTGRARLASRPEDVLADFQAGDVLVAGWTAPTYNAILAGAGAMVVEEGGLLCHAAVIARELGVPAVIGATGALAQIPEGALVTVDPMAGRVTVDATA